MVDKVLERIEKRECEVVEAYPSVLDLVRKLGNGSVSMGWLYGRSVSLAHAACIVALWWGTKVGKVGDSKNRFHRMTEEDGARLLEVLRRTPRRMCLSGNCVYDSQSIWVWEKRVSKTVPPVERLWIEEWEE